MRKYIDQEHKLYKSLADFKKKCKCGHTVYVGKNNPNKKNYVICSHCGTRVYYYKHDQDQYDRKVRKDEFIFKFNKCLNETLTSEINKDRKRKVNKKRLKKKTFKNNNDYFKFFNNDKYTVYIVEKDIKNGTIVIYYGLKIGRPKKK